MKSYYNKVFSTNSPLFFIFLIAVLFWGFTLRYAVPMPNTLPYSHIVALSKFGLTTKFITSASTFFIWVEFVLHMFTILAIFALGKVIVGKTAGICAALLFAIYPYFVTNMYSINIFLILSFILYLLFMYMGVHSMLRRWNFISGVFFTIALIIEPTCLLLGIIPYIYFMIKQNHVAVLQAFLYFLVGIIIMLGIFIFVAYFKGNLSTLLPLDNYFSTIWTNAKALFTHPIIYLTNTIIPYFKTFGHPIVNGANSYLHYVIITLSILGALYAFIQENVRILAIILIAMFFLAFFMTFEYSIVLIMLILLAGFMIDKVVSDVLT